LRAADARLTRNLEDALWCRARDDDPSLRLTEKNFSGGNVSEWRQVYLCSTLAFEIRDAAFGECYR
jgi:hypothetical protein